jgi:hypothetical protein
MSTGDPNLDSILGDLLSNPLFWGAFLIWVLVSTKVVLYLRKFPDKLVGYRNTAITSGLIGLVIAPGILSDLFIWVLPAPAVIPFVWGVVGLLFSVITFNWMGALVSLIYLFALSFVPWLVTSSCIFFVLVLYKARANK